jgi:hypothetical protein
MATVGPLIPALLLGMFLVAVFASASVVLMALRWRRKQLAADRQASQGFKNISASLFPQTLIKRPTTWLAVRSRNVHAVQMALGLHNVQPCTWFEGIAGEEKLFVAPPVKGWVLVLGLGLPDPADDVDICFRFLTHLSDKLGQVQFFKANRVLGHHAWVRVVGGKVVRAYAWAGKTLWNQGNDRRIEAELGMRCYDYFETPHETFDQFDIAGANVDKVSLLAGQWSVDPGSVDEHVLEHAYGIAGEPPRLY